MCASERKSNVLICSCVSHAFVHQTFARSHYSTFMPQSRQCDGNLLLVAAANPVCDYIYLVSSSKEVDGGLGNTDVTLNADDDARERAGSFQIVKGFLDFGCARLRERAVS
jgi:hypothetical protein